jgi:hypothetical protein
MEVTPAMSCFMTLDSDAAETRRPPPYGLTAVG